MWESFFGFKKTPFSDSPDAKQLFASQAWNQVKTRLEFLAQHHGVGLVTGEVGAGKSTAARVFTATLNASLYKILYVHFSSGRRWTCCARSLWNWTWNQRTSAATWCARFQALSYV
jgi:type II secretory pathway predicted ATPase ExeA